MQSLALFPICTFPKKKGPKISVSARTTKTRYTNTSTNTHTHTRVTTPMDTCSDFRAHPCLRVSETTFLLEYRHALRQTRTHHHKQHFPSELFEDMRALPQTLHTIRSKTSRSGEMKSSLGVGLSGRMQTSGSPMCHCVCPQTIVCVCVYVGCTSPLTMRKTVCVYMDMEIPGISIECICLWISVSIYQSARPHCQTPTHTHTHSLCLSFQQFVVARACVSLCGPHFECLLGYTLSVIGQQFFWPCFSVCVIVCVCVCVRERERERTG